jgi:hypothetical protein
MSWEMLAAVGQLSAVVIGIPSIIYLAVQVRHQTKERTHAAVHALTEQWGDITGSLHDRADLADIFLRGVRSFNDLDASEKVRFSALFNRLLTFFEGMYYSHEQRILTDSSWGAIERTIEDFFANRGVQEWWQTRKRWHTVEFARIVDAMIARASEATAFAHYAPSAEPKS